VTAQGSARTQYRRAIERKSLMGAEMALREMGAVDLVEALDYLAVLAERRPAKAPRAPVRWHGSFSLGASWTPLTSALHKVLTLWSRNTNHGEP
jgi:hypothetical protein